MSKVIKGDIDLGRDLIIGGGLKDAFVSTAIKLGSSGNTSFNTTKKDIVGAINELLASIGSGPAGAYPDFIRQKVDLSEQFYTKDNKIFNGYSGTTVCVGIVDNIGKPIIYG